MELMLIKGRGAGLRIWVVILMDSSINRDLGAIRNDAGLMLASVSFFIYLFIFHFWNKKHGEYPLDGGDGEARRSWVSFPWGLILSDRS